MEKKKSLLHVPIREALKRMAAGEKHTEQDLQEIEKHRQLWEATKKEIQSEFADRVRSIAPWFDHSNYAFARLCGILSQKFPQEPLSSWMDIPQDELLGYIDAVSEKPEESKQDTIPASYRYEGTLKGDPLTVEFCKDRFRLSSSMLSRYGKDHRMKSGRGYVYEWSFVKKLADEK